MDSDGFSTPNTSRILQSHWMKYQVSTPSDTNSLKMVQKFERPVFCLFDPPSFEVSDFLSSAAQLP